MKPARSLSDFGERLLRRIHALDPREPDRFPIDFDALARELFGLQYQANAPYRAVCDWMKKTPATLDHWSRIPAVPAASFKTEIFTALSASERNRVFLSSGTTGQERSQHWHSTESLRVYEASLRSWFRRFARAPHPTASGADGLKHLVCLTPPAREAPHSSLVHMWETLAQNGAFATVQFCGASPGDGSWIVEFEKAMSCLQDTIAQGQGVLVLGTAFNFVHLVEELARRRRALELPQGSILVETGGYKGQSRAWPKEALHQKMSEALGVADAFIVSEYGMSELSSQAYDRIAGGAPGQPRYFQFPPWARCRVISPETGNEVAGGQVGMIEAVDLANVWSVMAVQTEDLAIKRGERFELLGRVIGSEPRGCSLMSSPSSPERRVDSADIGGINGPAFDAANGSGSRHHSNSLDPSKEHNEA